MQWANLVSVQCCAILVQSLKAETALHSSKTINVQLHDIYLFLQSCWNSKMDADQLFLARHVQRETAEEYKFKINGVSFDGRQAAVMNCKAGELLSLFQGKMASFSAIHQLAGRLKTSKNAMRYFSAWNSGDFTDYVYTFSGSVDSYSSVNKLTVNIQHPLFILVSR